MRIRTIIKAWRVLAILPLCLCLSASAAVLRRRAGRRRVQPYGELGSDPSAVPPATGDQAIHLKLGFTIG